MTYVPYFLSKSCCSPLLRTEIKKILLGVSFVDRSGSGMIIEKSDSDLDPIKIIPDPQYCQLVDGRL